MALQEVIKFVHLFFVVLLPYKSVRKLFDFPSSSSSRFHIPDFCFRHDKL